MKKIREWDYRDMVGLCQFVCDLWYYKDWATYNKKSGRLRLATGGWSGNEEIVQALHENQIFQATCWEMSKRGGLTIYVVPKAMRKLSKIVVDKLI